MTHAWSLGQEIYQIHKEMSQHGDDYFNKRCLGEAARVSQKLRPKTPSETQKLRPKTPSESQKLRPKTPSESQKLRP